MTATQIPLFFVESKPPQTEFENSGESDLFFSALRAETQVLLALCNSFGLEVWETLQSVPTGVLRHASELFYKGRYQSHATSPRRAKSAKPRKKRRAYKPETLHRIRIGKLLQRAEKHYPLLPEMRSQFLQDAVARNPSYYGLCQISGESCPVPDLLSTALKRKALAHEQELLDQER